MTVAVRDGDSLGTAVDAELAQDVIDVRGDGLRADDEPLRDASL